MTRQIKGLLNRLSEANVASIASGIEDIYANTPRYVDFLQPLLDTEILFWSWDKLNELKWWLPKRSDALMRDDPLPDAEELISWLGNEIQCIV